MINGIVSCVPTTFSGSSSTSPMWKLQFTEGSSRSRLKRVINVCADDKRRLGKNNLIINVVLFIALLSCNTLLAKARPLGAPTLSLAVRLRLDEQSSDCWVSLVQLQACSGEIIMFFLNGEADLGEPCCHALRIIGEQCWPNMLGTLGFTTEEGEILEGYCVKSDGDHDHSPPAVVPGNKKSNPVAVPILARVNP